MSDQGDSTNPPPAGDEPQGDAPNPSQPWMIATGVLAVIALILGGLLLFGGDDDGDDDSAASTTSSSSTSTSSTTSSSTTTTTEASTTTSTSEAPATTTTIPDTPVTADPAQCEQAGSDPANPDPAATAVFLSWTRGDTACADPLMTDDALSELFGRDGAGASDIFQGCTEVDDDEGDPHMDCAFTYEGGSTHYLMNFSPTDGWQVFDIEQSAD